MPAFLIHFHTRRCEGSSEAGWAVPMPCSEGTTVMRSHIFLLPDMGHRRCKCRFLVLTRCCETMLLTRFWGRFYTRLFFLLSTLIQCKPNEEEANKRFQLWSRALQCRTVFYEILCLSSLLFPASSWACSTLLTSGAFRLLKKPGIHFPLTSSFFT